MTQRWLTKSGDVRSLRRFYARDGDFKRYGDVTTVGGAMILASGEQMFKRTSVVISLALALFGKSPAQEPVEPDPKPLIPLINVLDSASLSGSLEISGDCGSKRFPQFPQVRQGKSDSTLIKLGEMLSSNSGVTVSQDSNGIIRIIGPDVPTDFLNVKISHITFEGDKHNASLFSPTYAMWIVFAAPEVVAFFKSHDIEKPFLIEFFTGNPFVTPPPDSPHISGSLDNVTVGEVLDRILQSFPGVWFYGNCTQNEKHKRAIFVRFYRSLKRHNLVSGGM